jgi:hypothetical protein
MNSQPHLKIANLSTTLRAVKTIVSGNPVNIALGAIDADGESATKQCLTCVFQLFLIISRGHASELRLELKSSWLETHQAICSCISSGLIDKICSSLLRYFSTRVSRVRTHSRAKIVDK